MAAQNDVLSVIDWPDIPGVADLAIPAWYEQRASARPLDVAVVSSASRVSFAELNSRANRLAHGLLGYGGLPGDRVGVLMRHDEPLVAATLAILKAGRVVVVLNPADPVARLKQLMGNAGASLIVSDDTNGELATEVTGDAGAVLRAGQHMNSGPGHNPGVAVPADQLAFLIYTSGSTGEPKGVMRTHRQALQNALRMSRSIQVRADDRLALLFALSSEVGVTLSWAALLNGASLHPFPLAEKGVVGLPAWLDDHAITVLSVTASMYRQFVKSLGHDNRFPHVRVLRFGSEEVTSQDFQDFQRHFSDGCTLLHSFGSTEAGIVMHRRLSHQDTVPEGALAVGRPAYGIEVVLVDDEGAEVKNGEIGEIIVKSTSLSDGYWNRPDATAERFCEWPPGSGRRALRTGDLAKINAGGLLEFAGRKDMQVKVGGYRIELAEIEQALAQLRNVERAVVMSSRAGNQADVTAYLVAKPGAERSAPALRRELAQRLPRHMIPASFVFFDQFPIAPTGKVDRDRLRQMQLLKPERQIGELPRTETEKRLAELWAKVLESTAIGRDDDFFELGGDSLKATVISATVHEVFGVEIHLGTLIDQPTLAGLAEAIDEIRQAGSSALLPPLVRVPRDNPLPLSVYQLNAWKSSQTPEGLKACTAAESRLISGPLDRKVLGECMNRLAERHEMLRTTFPIVDGEPVQVVHPCTSVELPFIDLAGQPDADEQATRLLNNEAKREFDLGNGPLICFSLIRLRENTHRLVCAFHHILTDPWSWEVYLSELGLLYEARIRGEDASLESMPLQYGDFAAWQKESLKDDAPAYRAALDWWEQSLAGTKQALKLPFARAKRRKGLDPQDGTVRWSLEPAVLQRLQDLERHEHSSFFLIRIAAFAALLADATGEPDVVLGTYLTHRNRLALQNVFGPLFYLVALRFRIDLQQSFREWLANVRRTVADAEQHSVVPFERLHDGLRKRGVTPPTTQLIFNVFRNPARTRFANLELTKDASKAVGMPQGFHMHQNYNGKTYAAVFDAGTYDPIKVRELIERYRGLLDAVSSDPDLPVEQLLTMTSPTKARTGWASLLSWRP